MATTNSVLKTKSPLRYERERQPASSSKTSNGHPIHPPPSPVRSKLPSSRRSQFRAASISFNDHDSEPGRVRVSVRIRPKNDDELSDADSYDCVELQPELKRLKLRKNNWSSESYQFDEVFTEGASQKRVYEMVAKPVVESVLNGYNGTVMAYGQTGTGKTYTVGRLGKGDPSECGIMVRAMKDILATSGSFAVAVSYLQLYLDSVQDLLVPEKNNIPIVEDPKTGEVSLPGAAVIEIRHLDHFVQLLQIGETNRHAANTNLNTESSRSHAILMVYIRKTSQGKAENESSSPARDTKPVKNDTSMLLKSKLLIVDLAGSERIDKSGSEGHMLEEAKFINLSLTSLGKCINALAENSPHIPIRDSKLTRLLRDSFGGSARTSLIITIGPSARNHAETASTIMFGQRAMKIVNMLKLKEEIDYESLNRKLENQVDYLIAELERQQKLREDYQNEMNKKLRDCQSSLAGAEKNLASRSELLNEENSRSESEIKSLLGELKLQRDHNGLMHDEVARLEMSLIQSKKNHLENSTYQKVLAETTQMYEKKISELIEELEDEHSRSEHFQEQLNAVNKDLNDHLNSIQIHEQKDIDELRMKLQARSELHEKTINECQSLRTDNEGLLLEKIQGQNEIGELRMKVYELSQLYEKSAKDFQDLKIENEELFSDMIEGENEVNQLKVKLQEMCELDEKTLNEFNVLQTEHKILLSEKETVYEELCTLKQRLSIEERERKFLEDENATLLKLVSENDGDSENIKPHLNGMISEVPSELGTSTKLLKLHQPKESISSQRAAKIFDEVGLPKIVSMLSSEDLEVQIHAVKVVANLAAEDKNQEMIVEEGGLDALLMLLGTSKNATIHRVASGAIANLAMNEMNQVLIMSKQGALLLANIASKSDDTQTLRMVAGAIANLCGNQKLHVMLKEDGAIKALFRMVQSGTSDVIAQGARGIANFAKCESRGTFQGHRRGRSLLLEDGALTWLIANSTCTSSSTRRHIELALCHLAQNEENAEDFVSNGALKELVRISCQSSKEDIRSLAKNILKTNPVFKAEMQRT